MPESKYSAKLANDVCGCIAQVGEVEECVEKFGVNLNTWYSWAARKPKTLGKRIQEAIIAFERERLRPLELSMLQLAGKIIDDAKKTDKPAQRAYFFSVVLPYFTRHDRKEAQRAGREDAKFEREMKLKRLALEERRVAIAEEAKGSLDQFNQNVERLFVLPQEVAELARENETESNG